MIKKLVTLHGQRKSHNLSQITSTHMEGATHWNRDRRVSSLCSQLIETLE